MAWITGVATILWFILMTYLSHQTCDGTARTGKRIVGLLKGVDEAFLRTAAHIGCFLILTVLLLTTLRLATMPVLPGVLFAVLWAWGDEWTKQFIAGRHYELTDTAKNLTGVGLGRLVLLI